VDEAVQKKFLLFEKLINQHYDKVFDEANRDFQED
jgi:hypothetical protein